jgi:hypothetical protein
MTCWLGELTTAPRVRLLDLMPGSRSRTTQGCEAGCGTAASRLRAGCPPAASVRGCPFSGRSSRRLTKESELALPSAPFRVESSKSSCRRSTCWPRRHSSRRVGVTRVSGKLLSRYKTYLMRRRTRTGKRVPSAKALCLQRKSDCICTNPASASTQGEVLGGQICSDVSLYQTDRDEVAKIPFSLLRLEEPPRCTPPLTLAHL